MMRPSRWMVAICVGVILLGGAVSARSEFTPSTDAQLDAMLAAPATIPAAFKDATAEQAADIVLRAIGKIEAAKVTADQKKKAIAVFVAYAVYATEPNAAAMMAIVVKTVNPDILPFVVAAAVTVADDAAAMLAAIVAALGPESDAAAVARVAAASPETVLGSTLIQILLGLMSQVPEVLLPLPPVAGKYFGQ